MNDKEIEAGIKKACDCDCAPPSTGWTVNPFPIIRDYIERLKRRADIAECKYVIALNKYAKCDRKLTNYNKMTTTYDKEITQQAEREIEEEKGE